MQNIIRVENHLHKLCYVNCFDGEATSLGEGKL